MELTDKQNIKLLRIFSPRPLQSVIDDEAFFVNVDEVEKIHLAIETNENALIIGERGSGKTSLLNHLNYEYVNSKKENAIIPVQLNLLRIENFNQTTFLETLINNIFDSAMKFRTTGEKIRSILEKFRQSSSSNQNLKSFPITLEGNISYGKKEADFEILVERLERLVHALQNRNIQIFIIIDDGDKINSELLWNVFRGLRDTLWDLKISLILSVLPEQVSGLTKPPLDQFFPYWIKMKPYDQMRINKLILKRVKSVKQKIELDDDALTRLIKDTKGNPRSIISMMKRIFESKKNIDKITENMIDELDTPYSSELNSIERSVINYLVHKPYVSASSEDFSDSVGVSRSRVAQILNELKDKGLIKSEKEGRKMKYFITNKGLLKRAKMEEEKKLNNNSN